MKVFGYVFLVIFGTVNSQEICRGGEVNVFCKSPFEPTCSEPSPIFTPDCNTCEPGCVCRPNLLRDTVSNKCIQPSECPKSLKNTTCEGENVEFNWCASCSRTCQSPCREPQGCAAVCVEKCDCIPGFIRDEISSNCVEPSKCPRCKCPQNEFWTQCNKECEKTCYSIKNSENCIPFNSCTPGCLCARGFTRNEMTGKCIRTDKCFS